MKRTYIALTAAVGLLGFVMAGCDKKVGLIFVNHTDHPLEIEVEGPREGEVLLKVVASGVCHTDAFTLSGEDPEGAFPCVLGHEGGCEVVECGPGVKELMPGDHVIPLYIPECGTCEYCRSEKTNLCQSIASTVWTGYTPNFLRVAVASDQDLENRLIRVRCDAVDPAGELLVASPDLTLNRLEFAFPFKSRNVLDTVRESLKKAGLPGNWREENF